jgi:hypothetical protein
MDWRNYQFWRKKLRRVDETTAEFDLLVQRAKQRIVLGEQIRDVFDCSKGHPPVLKKFLSGKISLETLVIYNKIFLFGNKFDKKLLDPVWETVSLKLKKYSPFLNIDVFNYKKILRDYYQ